MPRERVQLWKTQTQPVAGRCVLFSHCFNIALLACRLCSAYYHSGYPLFIFTRLQRECYGLGISFLLAKYSFIFSEQMLSELGHPLTKVFALL